MNELIVLEIPHQIPARAWIAKNKDDYMEKIAEEFYCKDSNLDEIDDPTFDDYEEAAGEDLYSYYVMTVDEAVKAYRTDGESIKLGDHQKWKALSAIGKELNDLGVAYKKDSELKEIISEYIESLKEEIEGLGKSYAEDGDTRENLENDLQYWAFSENGFDLFKPKNYNKISKEEYDYVIDHMADELREPQWELINKELEAYDQEVMRLQQAKSKNNRSRRRP